MEICHSNMIRHWVPTLLDFIFEYMGVTYNYPTIIFNQIGYNLFTLWQAACRHYRLNQTKECRTFYMAYRRTLQEEALKLMAEKKVSTAAIQGQFSAEGLAAMAQGVDSRVRLAQFLSDNSSTVKGSIEEMFEKINAANKIELSEDDKIFLDNLKIPKDDNFEDLITDIDSNLIDNDIFELLNITECNKYPKEDVSETESSSTLDSLKLFDNMPGSIHEFATVVEDGSPDSVIVKENDLDSKKDVIIITVDSSQNNKKSKRNKRSLNGQLSINWL
ncbi:MAG: hypothetical protein MJA82_02100 [Clostridia bacterium]|nr:hypothetical protein [Clostridia bacterium]